MPFVKQAVDRSCLYYIPCAAMLLWFTMNATTALTAWTVWPGR